MGLLAIISTLITKHLFDLGKFTGDDLWPRLLELTLELPILAWR